MSRKTKRFLALALALVMLFSLSISAFATSDEEYVTVYITKDAFTSGGFDYENNTPISQQYIAGSNPENYTNSEFTDYVAFPIDIATIEDMMDRSIYNAPDTYTGDANVLDAIIVALQFCGYDTINAGWDANPVEGTPGGYINNVAPAVISYFSNRYETINGTTYTIYGGTGWNIACTQNGTIQPISAYGTNYALSDGMEIVFDYSIYNLYWAN